METANGARGAPETTRKWSTKRPFTKSQMETTLASKFIPKGHYDVLRDSLRRVIHRIDYRSSMCIAHLMMENWSEQEIYDYLYEWRLACKTFGWLNDRTEWDGNEEMRKICPHFHKILNEVERFRQRHAERLRDLDMRDVSICYNHGTVEQFKKELAEIEGEDGLLYHTWPGDAYPGTIAMSVIMKPSTYERLQLDDREDFLVFNSTLPAGVDEPEAAQSPMFIAGKMFPGYKPVLSKKPMHELSPNSQAMVRGAIKDICGNRKRSSSLDKIRNVERGTHKWYLFNSKRDPDLFLPQPTWYPEGQPFTKHLPSHSNHSWWQDDWPKHVERVFWRYAMARHPDWKRCWIKRAERARRKGPSSGFPAGGPTLPTHVEEVGRAEPRLWDENDETAIMSEPALSNEVESIDSDTFSLSDDNDDDDEIPIMSEFEHSLKYPGDSLSDMYAFEKAGPIQLQQEAERMLRETEDELVDQAKKADLFRAQIDQLRIRLRHSPVDMDAQVARQDGVGSLEQITESMEDLKFECIALREWRDDIAKNARKHRHVRFADDEHSPKIARSRKRRDSRKDGRSPAIQPLSRLKLPVAACDIDADAGFSSVDSGVVLDEDGEGCKDSIWGTAEASEMRTDAVHTTAPAPISSPWPSPSKHTSQETDEGRAAAYQLLRSSFKVSDGIVNKGKMPKRTATPKGFLLYGPKEYLHDDAELMLTDDELRREGAESSKEVKPAPPGDWEKRTDNKGKPFFVFVPHGGG